MAWSRLRISAIGICLAVIVTVFYHSQHYNSFVRRRGSRTLSSRNYLLSDDQCTAEFPELYDQIDISVRHYKARGGLKREMLEEAAKGPALTRVIVYDNQVYVKSMHQGYQSRVYAVLSDLHRAVVTSPEPLPNIDFIFGTADSGESSCGFGFARGKKEPHIWLMPCFSFWSWPETLVGDYFEVERKIDAVESRVAWDMKVPKLFWRGAPSMNFRRQAIIDRVENASWSDIKPLDWAAHPEDRRDIWDHCQYKYLAHVEGARYSARLKYLQHCESVVVMHAQEWVHHYSHLIRGHGSDQNAVVVGDDWGGLEDAMDGLLQNDGKARAIAHRSRKFFGQQYLTLSAEVCYWRRLIRGYASVLEFEPNLDASAVPVESVLMMRATQWDF